MTKQYKLLFADIETCPMLCWAWRTGKQYLGPEQVLEPTRIISIHWAWEGETEVHHLHWDRNQCDKSMLAKFSKVAIQADRIMGHNFRQFDIRHINARIAYHKLAPLDNIFLIEDTLKAARNKLYLPSYTLDSLGKYFGLGEKVKHRGIQMWLDIWLRKDKKALKEMLEYGDGDIVLLQKVYDRLKPYLAFRSMNLSVLNDDANLCPKCGTSGSLIARHKGHMTPLGFKRRVSCKACNAWSTIPCSENKTKSTEFPR